MLLHADFLDYLAKVRRVVFARAPFDSLDCPICGATVRRGDAWLDACTGETEAATDSRELLSRSRKTLCQRCRFDLLLHAIQTILPSREVPAWMERPNLDLEGRTPLQCVHQGNYAEVLEALWLTSEPGPCS